MSHRLRRNDMLMVKLAVLALLLTACSADGNPTVSAQPTGQTPGSAAPGSGAPQPAGELVVTFVEASGAAPKRWTLTCDPPGGTHPDPVAACAALERASAKKRDPFAPVPKNMACTEIYGGPQTATVTGTWRGRAVSSSFNRTNGCEIGRWDALLGLLPRGGAG